MASHISYLIGIQFSHVPSLVYTHKNIKGTHIRLDIEEKVETKK